MLRIYFDASALIKRYTIETGTPLVNELFRRVPMNQISTSALVVLEVVWALVRKRNDSRLTQEVYTQALVEVVTELISDSEIEVIQYNTIQLATIITLVTTHNLNASDAVLLRSVLNTHQQMHTGGDDMLFWTSDKRLARAAHSEGVAVFDPEIDTIARLNALLDTTY